MLSSALHLGAVAAPGRAAAPPRRRVAGRAGKEEERLDRRTGYIETDNTGRGNVFAIEPKKVYISSPTRDAEAKTGLGSPAYAVALGGVALAAAAISLASLRTPTAPPLDQTVTFFRFLFEEQLK